MKYGEYELNALQVSRVVEDFFDESFPVDEPEQAESYIAKRMEDTDGDFLKYNDEDIANLRGYLKNQLRELDKIQVKLADKDQFYEKG